jgi:hypothetical protein
VRLLVAEASALDHEYHSDRGVGAKFGASEKLANGYVRELLARIGALHERVTGRPGGVKVVYLPMPDALRAAGTFGTHWMMPPTVPIGRVADGGDVFAIEERTAIGLIDALFADPAQLGALSADCRQAIAQLGAGDALWRRLTDGMR